MAGRATRTVVTEFADDPTRFIATRREVLR